MLVLVNVVLPTATVAATDPAVSVRVALVKPRGRWEGLPPPTPPTQNTRCPHPSPAAAPPPPPSGRS
ncbi:MAG: hypothetical protein ACK5PF_02615, partial [bacterium]